VTLPRDNYMTNTVERSEESMTPLEAVMRRLDGSSGFPALSTTIADINRIAASDSESVSKLTRTILRDVAITRKLLHVVNSATFGQFGGRIHTVSKAVLILGFEAVRNAAMSLVLLEFSKGQAQARTMQDEIVSAFFAGVVSKTICEHMAIRNNEEAVICTMFQNLGKLLATFFLYDESLQVRELMATGLSEELASTQLLGISYRELGIGMAKLWNFPDRLVQGMQPATARDIATSKTDADKLRIAASLANDLCNTALGTTELQKPAALETLVKRYASAIKLDCAALTAAIDISLKEIAETAPALNLPIKNSASLHTIKTWAGDSNEAEADTDASAGTDTDVLLQNVHAMDAMESTTETSHDPEHILTAGIRDVTETLVSDFALNDVLQMVLETMYRGMGFTRTLIFIRDTKLGTMRARFGFGEHIERIIPKCVFPLAFAPDVFHVALDKGVDIVIEDALAPKIVSRIPQWHQQAMTAKSFLLLPVMVKNQAIGLFYADSEHAEGLKITPQHLGLLRTLRSQVILALKQKM
jgi:HD-like signal output (HDOD) protein